MQSTSADTEKTFSITQRRPALDPHNHQTAHQMQVYKTDQIKQEHDPWQSK